MPLDILVSLILQLSEILMEDKPLWPIYVYIISIIYKVILKYFRILVEGSHFGGGVAFWWRGRILVEGSHSAGGSRRVASPNFGYSVKNLGIRYLNFCSGKLIL